MAKLTPQQRFVQSRCDRCGRGTSARQNNTGDLYVLPETFEELADEGDFCQKCIDRYDLENWRRWFKAREQKPPCEYCGKPVGWAMPCHMETGRARFCSRRCRAFVESKIKESDWPEIVRLYRDERLTAEAIGARYGCTTVPVLKVLRRFNVLRHSKPGKANGMYGHTHTSEAREKIREANRRQFSTEEARQRHAELTAKQIQDGRTGKSFNKLERAFAAILDSVNASYQWQFKLDRFVFDFLLLDILIETHGTFWHADPRFYDHASLKPAQAHNIANDVRKEAAALAAGYRFLRVWEYDVHNHPDRVKSQILTALAHHNEAKTIQPLF